MTSQLEQQIRELDDNSKKITPLSIELAKKLGASQTHCFMCIYANREGYNRLEDLKTHLAVLQGYDSRSEKEKYRSALIHSEEAFTLEDFRKEKENNQMITYVDPKHLKHIPYAPEKQSYPELKKMVSMGINAKLTKKERRIVYNRHWLDQTFEEMDNTTKQNTQKAHKRAINKLRRYIIKNKN